MNDKNVKLKPKLGRKRLARLSISIAVLTIIILTAAAILINLAGKTSNKTREATETSTNQSTKLQEKSKESSKPEAKDEPIKKAEEAYESSLNAREAVSNGDNKAAIKHYKNTLKVHKEAGDEAAAASVEAMIKLLEE